MQARKYCDDTQAAVLERFNQIPQADHDRRKYRQHVAGIRVEVPKRVEDKIKWGGQCIWIRAAPDPAPPSEAQRDEDDRVEQRVEVEPGMAVRLEHPRDNQAPYSADLQTNAVQKTLNERNSRIEKGAQMGAEHMRRHESALRIDHEADSGGGRRKQYDGYC